MTISLPAGDYKRKQFAQFCERFNCKLQPSPKGQKHLLVVSAEDPINFFWLGANINFYYKSGYAISAASELLDAPDHIHIANKYGGHATFDSPPDKKTLDAVNAMADIAYKKIKK